MPGAACLERKQARKAEKRQTNPGAPEAKLRRRLEEGLEELPPGVEPPNPAPDIDDLEGDARERYLDFLRVIYEACGDYGEVGVTVSQLGAHPKVQGAKKACGCSVTFGIVDVLKKQDQVFELEMGGQTNTSTWMVRLQEHAVGTNPFGMSADQATAEEALAILPTRIDEPTSMEEAFQALRIEVIHALFRRGGIAQLNEIGQEPRVNKFRSGTTFAIKKKLIEPVQIFPDNFHVEDKGNGNFEIHLVSTDVTERAMITKYLSTVKSDGKGKGKEERIMWYKGKGKPGPAPWSFGKGKIDKGDGGIWVWQPEGASAQGMLAGGGGKGQGMQQMMGRMPVGFQAAPNMVIPAAQLQAAAGGQSMGLGWGFGAGMGMMG